MTTSERLRAILVRDYQLDYESLRLDAPLEALGIDSLGAAELLFNVEDDAAKRVSPDGSDGDLPVKRSPRFRDQRSPERLVQAARRDDAIGQDRQQQEENRQKDSCGAHGWRSVSAGLLPR